MKPKLEHQIQIAETTSKRQRTLDEYFKNLQHQTRKLQEWSLDLIYPDLIFNQIAQNSFIRESLITKYPKSIVPKHHTGVAAKMISFYEIVREESKQRIHEMKSNRKKFSATLDEWTSSIASVDI